MTFLPRKQSNLFYILQKRFAEECYGFQALLFHFSIFVTYAAQITMEKIVIADSVAETVPTCKRICLKLEILSISLRDFPCSI